MIEKVQTTVPNSDLYIQSVLPISTEVEKECADNDVILAFNEELEMLASEYSITYIDIHQLYTYDGSMNPELTKDGIHLNPEAYDQWYEAIRSYVEQ